MEGGEEVYYNTDPHPRAVYDAGSDPDRQVDDFNRKVITQLNETGLHCLGPRDRADPREKTLIFCVNDAHADLAVSLLEAASEPVWCSRRRR